MIAEQEAQKTDSWGPDALEDAREAGRKQQDSIAGERDQWIRSNHYFYDRIRKSLQFIIDPGKRVLDLRCETGHMLASVKPSHGVGVEIGDEMVACARKAHPDLYFVKSDLETLDLNETFDYIIFNHIFDTVDILRAMERIKAHSTPDTLLLIINYNYVWQPVLELASKIGLRSKLVEPNWVSENEVTAWIAVASSSSPMSASAAPIVAPRWNASKTRGSMYDARATAGVFPR